MTVKMNVRKLLRLFLVDAIALLNQCVDRCNEVSFTSGNADKIILEIFVALI